MCLKKSCFFALGIAESLPPLYPNEATLLKIQVLEKSLVFNQTNSPIFILSFTPPHPYPLVFRSFSLFHGD